MIAIPNMDKPKECKKCNFGIVEAKVEGKIYPLNAYCFVQHQSIKDFTDCPIIDIVTCGECKRSGTDGEHTFCMWLGALREPTDFCSYGERRE